MMNENQSIDQSFATQLPIVMISMSRWDGDFSSAAWSLAQTFARTRPVLYVDYPYTISDFFRERRDVRVQRRKKALKWGGGKRVLRLSQFSGELYALTPPLMLPANRFSPGRLYDGLKAFNDNMLARSITEGLKELGFEKFIFFNSFNPLYLTRKPAKFEPELFLYQSRDNIRALEPYLRKHGAAGEIEAIQQADFSFATARQLQKDLQKLSREQVRYLPNAANFDSFKTAYEQDLPMPEELKSLKRPIIGYTGNICHRSNYDLLEKVCEAHSDKSVVMVGPRNHWKHTDIDLDAIPNLHFTGGKPIEALPAYLAHFDALILPFLCNEVTRSIYPLKINEYLASGKPVIATPFSEDIRSFSDVIELADTPAEFATAISQALESDSPELARARYERAARNTWQDRVSQIDSWIEEAADTAESA
jgi:glycosyltransferase involved in cell wall biosynthesis